MMENGRHCRPEGTPRALRELAVRRTAPRPGAKSVNRLTKFESKLMSGPGPLPGPRGESRHAAGRAKRQDADFAPID
jgi:hypothetical protein